MTSYWIGAMVIYRTLDPTQRLMIYALTIQKRHVLFYFWLCFALLYFLLCLVFHVIGLIGHWVFIWERSELAIGGLG